MAWRRSNISLQSAATEASNRKFYRSEKYPKIFSLGLTLGLLHVALLIVLLLYCQGSMSEVFGDSSSDPASTTFDDDDDENPDGELNSSASSEDPDGEGAENYLDEAYEEPEGAWAGAESIQQAHWAPIQRRNKRDLNDGQVLASRILDERRRKQEAARSNDIDDLDNADDGDQDAWVHDGVDDMQIDPETRRASDALSNDEKSIDADYDPNQEPDRDRTRITTISEVIPMTSNLHKIGQTECDDAVDEAGTQLISDTSNVRSPNIKLKSYLPAAHLNFHQAQRLAAEHKSEPTKTDRVSWRQPGLAGAGEPTLVLLL